MPTWLQVGMLDVVEEMQELEVTEEESATGREATNHSAGGKPHTRQLWMCVCVCVCVCVCGEERGTAPDRIQLWCIMHFEFLFWMVVIYSSPSLPDGVAESCGVFALSPSTPGGYA